VVFQCANAAYRDPQSKLITCELCHLVKVQIRLEKRGGLVPRQGDGKHARMPSAGCFLSAWHPEGLDVGANSSDGTLAAAGNIVDVPAMQRAQPNHTVLYRIVEFFEIMRGKVPRVHARRIAGPCKDRLSSHPQDNVGRCLWGRAVQTLTMYVLQIRYIWLTEVLYVVYEDSLCEV
jgi:hypothetical protein